MTKEDDDDDDDGEDDEEGNEDDDDDDDDDDDGRGLVQLISFVRLLSCGHDPDCDDDNDAACSCCSSERLICYGWYTLSELCGVCWFAVVHSMMLFYYRFRTVAIARPRPRP